MALVKANGINLNAEAFGQGQPVIVVHGLGGNLKVMYPLMELLKKHYQVILYDCRGHGASDKPAAYTLEDHADDLLGLMDTLGLEKASLIGFSMGSYIAALAAAKAPERCSKLVLLGSKAHGLTPSVDQILRDNGLDPAKVTTKQMSRVMSKYSFYPRTWQLRRLSTMWHQFRNPLSEAEKKAESASLANFDLRPDLPKITASTLVITGQHDGINPPHLGKEVAALIPNARFEILHKAGHFTFTERKKRLQKMLLDFLSGGEKASKEAKKSRVIKRTFQTVGIVVLLAYFACLYFTAWFDGLYLGTVRADGWYQFVKYQVQSQYWFREDSHNDVLLIGSSSLDFWPKENLSVLEPYVVRNHAISGTQIDNINYFSQELIFDYEPSAIVFYCGWNNINAQGASADELYYLTLSLFEKIKRKLPDVKIVYVSFTPSPKGEKFKDVSDVAMAMIKEYCDENDWLDFVDSNEVFLTEDGEINLDMFVQDEIHPTDEAYLEWGIPIKESLDRLFAN